MATQIQEPITTSVTFDRAHIRPAWFLWNRRRYTVHEVTQRWQTKEGTATILHLGVTDGATTFELTFNQHTLVWHVASVEADSPA